MNSATGPDDLPSARGSRAHSGGTIGTVTSDEALLYAWREGDLNAGNALVERHYGPVKRFFGNKLTVTQDRDDLVQETFKGCVLGRDRLADPSRFKAYLYRIAHNVLKRHLHRKYRAVEEELATRSMADIEPGPSTMVRDLEEQRRMLLALRELPVDWQTALELKYWEGMKSPDIAIVLGVEASTVRSYLKRGRALLERKLEGAAPPGGGEPEGG
jgi:RNA polymerase sigma-70 factor (ECF subfamily)